jgi:hypothetical protein
MKYLFTLLVLVDVPLVLGLGLGLSSVVNVDYARYRGVFNSTANVTSFLGLRFAAPPTGTLVVYPLRIFLNNFGW